MSDRRAAARYAEALLNVATSRRTVEEVRRELDALVALVQSTPLLQTLLARPDLPEEEKWEMLSRALGDQFSEAMLSLLRVLLDHRRGEDLSAVRDSYHELADAAAGIVRAEAASVVPLTQEQRRRLLAALAKLTGKNVILHERIDPAVLAGVSVQVGSRLIDGSAAGRLSRLREALLEHRE